MAISVLTKSETSCLALAIYKVVDTFLLVSLFPELNSTRFYFGPYIVNAGTVLEFPF